MDAIYAALLDVALGHCSAEVSQRWGWAWAAHQCLAPRWRWEAPIGVLAQEGSMGVAATKAANSGVDRAVCSSVGSLAARRSK